MNIDQVMQAAPVIPVLVLDGQIDPVALAETLVAAGLPVIEVTMRTPFALDAIRAMTQVEGAIVGAGTVLNTDMLDQALAAGSQFIVAPGLTETLARAAIAGGIPFLPGIATSSDLMRGLDLGLERFKFFHAQSLGGPGALKALSGPFGAVRFCPTGGIDEASAAGWLALPAVSCVGGSWIVQPGETDLAMIGQRARRAAAVRDERKASAPIS